MEREDEVEAQAPEIGLASRRSGPHQHVNTSTSTSTTITTDDCGSFSEHYCGDEATPKIYTYKICVTSQHVNTSTITTITTDDCGSSSKHYCGDVDFCDSKTSTGDVMLDLTAKEFGIQNSGGINLKDEENFKNKRTPGVNSPRSKDSLQDQNANDTFINNETTEHWIVDSDFTEGSELKETNLEIENKRLDTDNDQFYLRKLKACIDTVIFCTIKCLWYCCGHGKGTDDSLSLVDQKIGWQVDVVSTLKVGECSFGSLDIPTNGESSSLMDQNVGWPIDVDLVPTTSTAAECLFESLDHNEEWGEARMSRAPNPGIKRGTVTVLPPPLP